MHLTINDGWLEGVRQLRSPNFDQRPEGAGPTLLVVHGISLPPGEFGGGHIDRLFTNDLDPGAHPYFVEIAHLRVASHVLIDRAGEVTQYVSFLDRAWHAGESSYCGQARCNDFSVGIELEGTDDFPYAPVQYETLARVVASLRNAYVALREAEIVGHCDIAPGRKTDPGPAFDWTRLQAVLAGLPGPRYA
jgi:AmpD protein